MVLGMVEIVDPIFLWSVATIIFNPIFWNFIARREYRTRFLTRLCFGSAYVGCYLLALCIFLLGVYRDKVFADALAAQPVWEALGNPLTQGLSALLYISGLILVVSSYWRLGITGTYLGDYFGILMKERVIGFPFNVTANPMYNGSVMLFVAHALWNRSPAGLLLSTVVWLVYKIALLYEEPFTEMIYNTRVQKKPPTNNKKK